MKVRLTSDIATLEKLDEIVDHGRRSKVVVDRQVLRNLLMDYGRMIRRLQELQEIAR